MNVLYNIAAAIFLSLPQFRSRLRGGRLALCATSWCLYAWTAFGQDITASFVVSSLSDSSRVAAVRASDTEWSVEATDNTRADSKKTGTKLTETRVFTAVFPDQLCNSPVVTNGTVFITASGGGNRLSGSIISAQISGAHASDFQLIRPAALPAPVSNSSGALIELRFNGSAFGTRTAQLTITTADSTGTPLPDTILVNLIAYRGLRSFELIQQTFDFGTLPPNTQSVRTFDWLRNTGTEPLSWSITTNFDPRFTVLSANPSPILFLGPPTRFVTTIQPGEILSLTIRFNGAPAGQYVDQSFSPSDVQCQIQRTFRLLASTTQNPPNITVRRASPSEAVPVRQEIYLGEFACSESDAPFKDTTFSLYNSGQQPLIVRGARFSHPDFQIINPPVISPQDSIVIPFNTSRNITVRYTPRTPSLFDIEATLELLSNAANTAMTGSTTVNFRVRKDSIRLEASRALIDFGSVRRGALPGEQTVVVRNTGTLPQALTPFSGRVFSVSFPTNIVNPGDSVVATVRVINTDETGILQETWRIVDNCARETPITFRVSVTRPLPTIGLAVPVNFGTILCASDTVITQTITNTGDDAEDLVITDLTFVGTGGVFSFVNPPILPLVIPSGESRQILLRFMPTGAGSATGTLRIESNASDNAIFDAPVVGVKDSTSFTLSRTQISFVNLLPNTPASDTLRVRNTGSVPIRWNAALISLSGPFTLQVAPQETPPGGESVVTVNFLGSQTDATGTGFARDVCGRSQTLQARATILPPYIEADRALSFGTLSCETSSTAQITIKNTGGQDLLVSGVTSSSPLFLAPFGAAFPIRLRAGADTTLTVRFQPQPTTLGATSASLSMISNAANAASSGGATVATLSAMKNTLDFEFLDLTPTDSPNALSRFLGDAPPNAPLETTLRLRNMGNQPIFWQTPIYSLDSLFVVESVAQNPTLPGETTAMTVRFRGSACSGLFITSSPLTVLENYGFDCNKAPALVTLSARTLPATAQIETGSIRAGVSDTTSLPIYLRNPQYLREAGVEGFTFVLRYDFSTLVPLDAPRGAISGGWRLQPVTLPLPATLPADGVIGRVRFQATLGSTSGTALFLDSLRAYGGKGAECLIIDRSAAVGAFELDRICLEGGQMRLVTAATVRTSLAQSRPNPAFQTATIDFSLLERGRTMLMIYSVLGELVSKELDEILEPGEYSLGVDVSRFRSGSYFYVLQTPTERKTRRMEVVR
jgi:hypothetical protein